MFVMVTGGSTFSNSVSFSMVLSPCRPQKLEMRMKLGVLCIIPPVEASCKGVQDG